MRSRTRVRATIDVVDTKIRFKRVYPAAPRVGEVLEIDETCYGVLVVHWTDPRDPSGADIYLRVQGPL